MVLSSNRLAGANWWYAARKGPSGLVVSSVAAKTWGEPPLNRPPWGVERPNANRLRPVAISSWAWISERWTAPRVSSRMEAPEAGGGDGEVLDPLEHATATSAVTPPRTNSRRERGELVHDMRHQGYRQHEEKEVWPGRARLGSSNPAVSFLHA